MAIRQNWIVLQGGQGLDSGDHLVVSDTGIWVTEKSSWWYGGPIQINQNASMVGMDYMITDDQTNPGLLICDYFLNEGPGVVWTAQEGGN